MRLFPLQNHVSERHCHDQTRLTTFQLPSRDQPISCSFYHCSPSLKGLFLFLPVIARKIICIIFQMRNGPGQYSMGSRHLEHAFDGYAKPHNIRFQGDGASTAYYTTRFIRSKYYLGIYLILFILLICLKCSKTIFSLLAKVC